MASYTQPREEEPCTNCGGDVEFVWIRSEGMRAGRRLPPAPQLVGMRHVGERMVDTVDGDCTRGQVGPTGDYGDG